LNNGMTANLDQFYQTVGAQAYIPTTELSQRWTTAVLQTLGFHLPRRTKRALAKALPADLGPAVTAIFWLLHFRDPNLTAEEFQKQVAKRSGHTDAVYARFPILAIFGAIKQQIDPQLSAQIAGDLPPEVRALWEKARSEK
jgi:uncharacterized protein (DUF2267 family)